jgi:hypothetical protein
MGFTGGIMAQTVIIHLVNEDPILVEVEDLENLDGPVLECMNPRRRDGKRLHYIDPEATSFLFPWHRISFIELMPSEMERGEVVEFFRD